MIDHVVDFYKSLFGVEENLGVRLGDNFWEEEDKITPSENELLEAPFSEEEIKTAVFESYAEGAPGPDGISFVFYQKFWDLVKGDLVKMFNDFFNGELDLYRLNFAMISLIPKEEGVRNMKKFRPISLINCNFKKNS